MMLYPLAICGACIITSIIGTFFVKLGANRSIMGALYKGLIVTGVLSMSACIAGQLHLTSAGARSSPRGTTITGMNLFICGLVGLRRHGLIIVVITEYYTGTNKRPVKSIAQASVTGHGTNVIQGLAVSLESTALPAIVIIGGIIVTYQLAGLFGIAIATTTMLALAGMIVALDAFGPVTDNAGGIAEMAGLPRKCAKSTDALDAVGNTTKAVTKGYAIGSAGLGAWCCSRPILERPQLLRRERRDLPVLQGRRHDLFDLSNPYVVVGLLFGGLMPFLFGGMGMTAVGRAARPSSRKCVVSSAKAGHHGRAPAKPDYGRAVDLLTKAAIKEMIVPSLLPVLAPIVVYFVIY
jgi:K(+)-stimulated pyrophosphate-energized sodium pump